MLRFSISSLLSFLFFVLHVWETFFWLGKKLIASVFAKCAYLLVLFVLCCDSRFDDFVHVHTPNFLNAYAYTSLLVHLLYICLVLFLIFSVWLIYEGHVAGFCALCAIQKHVSRALQSTGRSLVPKDLVSNLRCILLAFSIFYFISCVCLLFLLSKFLAAIGHIV